jgi:para-nitrobenzyl esterase
MLKKFSLKRIRAIAIVMLAVAIAGVIPVAAQTTNKATKDRLDLVERTVDAQTPDAASDLGGTSWQLVKFQGGDDKTLIPGDKTKYTITFNAEGSVNVRFDCNRGRGTWKSPEPNQLQFGSLALTRVKCPPESLYDRIAKDWALVQLYTIKDGHLFLSLMADGGIYEFEPISKSQPGETK